MQVRESLARDLLRLVVWYPLRLLAERLPPRAALALYRTMGRLHALLARGRAGRIAAAAAAVAPHLPPAPSKNVAGEAFSTHYVNQLILFQLPRLTAANIDELLEFEGLTRLELALAHGRGVVLPIGHFGPTQLPLAALGALGFSLVQIGNLSDAGLSFIGRHVAFRLRQRYEARIPARIVPPGPGTRQALAHLRRGGVVMTTADDGPGQPPFGHHAVFPFPGGNLSVPLGPARLALAAGAVLLPVFLQAGTDAPYRLVIDEPIAPPPDAGREDAAAAMTAAWVARYAPRVQAAPGWWHGLEAHLFP
ncbi:lipid A biosynthesis acyltransferase [Desulfovibrio sp. DV]|uniref:LpxL/LpxP family acyltransferase n=1 Tax=Desulfovibrio sp. DV TaxID=1844708 RepID=UPI00094B8AA2|nr:lauroyl acyltransferase [Desulfovibrio sp. DV]OLN24544.1 lipid A biosynthesis acyltransferase [Desulfovibrio sp. DV]